MRRSKMTNKIIGEVVVRGIEYNMIVTDTEPKKVIFEKKTKTQPPIEETN